MSQDNKKSTSVDLAKVHAFLMGTGTLEGVSFGERHPGYVGMYWWRKSLSDAIVGASLSQSSTPEPANSIHTFEFAEVFAALLRADRKIAKTGASRSPEWIAAYDALIAYIDNFAHVVQQGGEQSKTAGSAREGGNTQPESFAVDLGRESIAARTQADAGNAGAGAQIAEGE